MSYPSPGVLTSEIRPPKRSSIARTIGSCSNRARNSRAFCSVRMELPVALPAVLLVVLLNDGPVSSLTQTRSGWPSTRLVIVRNFSIDSRPCNNSASARLSVGK